MIKFSDPNKRKTFFFALWLLAFVSYFLGIYLPIATVEKFYFFDNEFSLLGSLLLLLNEVTLDNLFLFFVLFLFTFIFPITKLLTLFLQIIFLDQKWENRATKLIEMLGHFSMVDAFVIALMVLMLKLDLLVNVYIHVGFYIFTLSIILSILLSYLLKKTRKVK